MKTICVFCVMLLTSFFAKAQYRMSDFSGKESNETNPSNLVKFNGRILFLASDASGKRNIWQSDGTEAGTTLFMEATLSQNSNVLFSQVIVENQLYFSFNQALWKMSADFVPTKIMEDGRQGFFDVFILIQHKLFFNLTHYLDLRTQVVKKTVFKNNLSYANNRYWEARPAGVDFWVTMNPNSPYSTLIVNNATDDSTRLLKISFPFSLHKVFNIGTKRFITSYLNATLSIYEVLPDTLLLVSEKIVTVLGLRALSTGYQIVSINSGRIVSLVFDGTDWQQTFEITELPYQINSPNQFIQWLEVTKNGNEVLLLGQLKGQDKSKLYTLNLDTGKLTPKIFEVDAIYCNFLSANDNYIFVFCTIQNSAVYFAIDKNTTIGTEIDSRWDFKNTLTVNKTLFGGYKVEQEYISDVTPPPIIRLATGLKDIITIKKIVKKNGASAVQILNDSDKIGFFVLADKNNDATIYSLEEQTLTPKEIVGSTGTPARKIWQYNNTPINLTLLGYDYRVSQSLFININKQTKTATKALYSLNYIDYNSFWIDSSFVFFEGGEKYTAPYSQQGAVQKVAVRGSDLLAKAVNKTVIGYFLYFIYCIDEGCYFAIIDLRNNYVYQPIAQKVRQMQVWQNQVIVVVGNDVYAFGPDEPIKQKYLFTFEYNFDDPAFNFLYFHHFFTLDNGKEFWRSQATCQSSKRVFINYSAQPYSVSILNRYQQYSQAIMTCDRRFVTYDSQDKSDKYELTTSVQFTEGISDHSFVYTVYDNNTIRLFHYDFLTKQRHELATVSTYFSGPFYPLSVYNNYPKQSISQIRFGNQQLFVLTFANQSDEIIVASDVPQLYQSLASATGEHQLFDFGNQLMITDGRRFVKIDSTNQYQPLNYYYYQKFTTTKNIYLAKSNADIVKVSKSDLSYKVIKAKPEWLNIDRMGLIGQKLYALVNEQSRGVQFWYIEDNAGEPIAQPSSPQLRQIEKNQCESKPDANSSPIFVVYPNPVQDDLNLLLLANELKTPFNIEIFNVVGQKFFEQTFQKKSNEDYIRRFNLYGIAAGQYLIRCTLGSQTHTIKFVKE